MTCLVRRRASHACRRSMFTLSNRKYPYITLSLQAVQEHRACASGAPGTMSAAPRRSRASAAANRGAFVGCGPLPAGEPGALGASPPSLTEKCTWRRRRAKNAPGASMAASGRCAAR